MSTSPTTTSNLPHPGDWLVSEMPEPMGITPYRLAKDIHVSESQISRLAEARVTVDTSGIVPHSA
ncbi:helix-turn-helix transcriptional regulator [Corynebacterium glyciniphilum]|uniref:helix-turn-helix transcriptional regulator n=1 Tax=Corynebacterium glyciniphilum TaxID=1404244 RepID=UPI0011AB8470|nr:hypothetical protein [Corynebacterium glyciniphilum]